MDGPSSDSSKNTSLPREASEQEIRAPSVTPLSTHSGMMSGARWAALLQALGQAISWLSTIVVVRFVSPTDYGLFAMLESPLELLLLVALLGMDVALVRVRNIAPPAESAAFGLLLDVLPLLLWRSSHRRLLQPKRAPSCSPSSIPNLFNYPIPRHSKRHT